MKPNKPGWFWLGILGPEPEVVHVRQYCGELYYQRSGAIGDQQVSWTIDEIWGDEIKIREIKIEYRQCYYCGAWNIIRADEYIVDCKCSCEVEVTPSFKPWPEWAISAMEAGFIPPNGWSPNKVTK